MPIVDLQVASRELGRIRAGVQEPLKGRSGTRPKRLDTFRLTSPRREYIDAAAQHYGGQVRPWQSPRGPEFEVIVESPAIDVIIPPTERLDPWYELWRGGGCVRRCDGITNILGDGGKGGPCECPSDPRERMRLAGDGEACKPTTRMRLALPFLPDLGVWRLETHSWYAAVELSGAIDTIQRLQARGLIVRAELRLEARRIKRPGQPAQEYNVPILTLPDVRMSDYLPASSVGELEAPSAPAIAAPRAPALPPPPELPEASTLRAPGPSTPGGDASAERDPGTGLASASPPPASSSETASADADAFVVAPEGATDDVAAPGASTEPEAATTSPADTLVGELRRLAARSGLVGAPTTAQREQLGRLFAGLEVPTIQGGIRRAFGAEDGRFHEAAQAQAVITVAARTTAEEFVRAWASLTEEGSDGADE